jgi:hypothetical protein
MFMPTICLSSLFLSLHPPSHSHSLSPTGVESSLELLDLERNRLSNISAAFGQLSGLRYLYLSNNNISEVPEAAFQSFAETLQARGLQLYTFFWNFNRNQTENDRYWPKNNYLLLAKCLYMYGFFAFAFKVFNKCYYDPNVFFLEKYQYGYKKTQNFMLISNSLMPALKKMPLIEVKSKKPRKNAQKRKYSKFE